MDGRANRGKIGSNKTKPEAMGRLSKLLAMIALAIQVAVPSAFADGHSVHVRDGGAVIADVAGHVELQVPLSRATPWKLQLLDYQLFRHM